MKKYLLLLTLFYITVSNAQNYNNILNYSIHGTPVNGVKIKTNLPFQATSQMPTITITGFNYGTQEPINLTLVYYIFFNGDSGNPSNNYFHGPRISSAGSYTPQVYLLNENGKVVIFINDRVYYQRFTLSVFAQGMEEIPNWFQGWTTADEPMMGTQITEVPYQNRFKGNVFLSGNSIWNADGNVGVGTTTPDSKLTVAGNIHAREVKVTTTAGNVPDYVFADDYKLKTLKEVEDYIRVNSHLPEIPSAKEIEKNGLMLAEMNLNLLKKIEELTLYTIEQEKKSDKMMQYIELQNKLIIEQNKRLEKLERISR